MSESVVDLTYRGLPLGRRIKLTEIRPSTGYLELPAPMPVGTRLAIATDEGPAIEAVVTGVHEQAAGAERAPGMRIAPALDDAAAASWWKERVALPELEPPAASPRPRRVTVLPRTRTVESPPPVHVAPATPPAAEPADPAAPAAGSDGGTAEPELLAAEADPPIVDDGKKTVMMESIDLGALGLEAGASGQFAASAAEPADDAADADDEGGEGEGEDAEDAEHAERAGSAGDAGPAGHAASTSTNGDPSQPVLPADRKQPHGKKRKKRR